MVYTDSASTKIYRSLKPRFCGWVVHKCPPCLSYSYMVSQGCSFQPYFLKQKFYQETHIFTHTHADTNLKSLNLENFQVHFSRCIIELANVKLLQYFNFKKYNQTPGGDFD